MDFDISKYTVPVLEKMIASNEWPPLQSAPKSKKSNKSEVLTTKSASKCSVLDFLQLHGRKLHFVIGDGSCLFRVLSFAVLGDEGHDYLIRSTIVRLINLNQKLFTNYLMGVNCSTIKEQIRHMDRPNSWGTHLEIIGAATLFRVPVYYCTQSATSSQFTWGVFHPISADRISFPSIVEEVLLEPRTSAVSHIEMYYHDSVHYDAIVSIETGKMCTTPPHLTGIDNPDIIELN